MQWIFQDTMSCKLIKSMNKVNPQVALLQIMKEVSVKLINSLVNGQVTRSQDWTNKYISMLIKTSYLFNLPFQKFLSPQNIIFIVF